MLSEFFLCKTGGGTCGQYRQTVSQLCVHLTHIIPRTRKLLRSVRQVRDLHLPLSAGEWCYFFITASRFAVVYLDTVQKGLYKSNWFGFAIVLFRSTSRCLQFKSLFIYFFQATLWSIYQGNLSFIHQANLRFHMKCLGKFLRYNKYLNEYLKKTTKHSLAFVYLRVDVTRERVCLRNSGMCSYQLHFSF